MNKLPLQRIAPTISTRGSDRPWGASSLSKAKQSGLNPKTETLGKGTLCRERNCEWQRDEWGGIRRSFAEWW